MKRGFLNMLGMAAIGLAACQPQPPDDPTPRSRAPGADDTTPRRAEPSQSAPQPAPPGGAAPRNGTSPGTPPGTMPAGTASADQAAPVPPPEQVEDALAACARQPADQQEPCRQRIRQAVGSAANEKR